jgi:HEAT repeat protein
VHLLGDSNQVVQDAALRSLDLFDGEKRRKLLLTAIEKGGLLLKCRALLSLGKMQDAEAIDGVAKYLDSKVLYLRLAAVESLDAMRSPKALEKIVKAFKDEYERPRWNAVDAFNRTKCKAGIEPLIEAIGEKTARIMDEEELATIKEVLVPAGFTILTGEQARMQQYIPNALAYQTGVNLGNDKEKWREWWEKNKELFDNQMNRVMPGVREGK